MTYVGVHVVGLAPDSEPDQDPRTQTSTARPVPAFCIHLHMRQRLFLSCRAQTHRIASRLPLLLGLNLYHLRLTRSLATMADAQLYEETFQCTTLLTETYDRVHRVLGTSHDNTTSITLDINSELYPIGTQDSFNMLIASTLNLDGTKEEAATGWRPRNNEPSLADMWDYVCYGKVYKVEDPEDGDRM